MGFFFGVIVYDVVVIILFGLGVDCLGVFVVVCIVYFEVEVVVLLLAFVFFRFVGGRKVEVVEVR